MSHKKFLLRSFLLIALFFILDFIISAVILNGLNRYYGINQKPDILINGSSMALAGFNRSTIEQRTHLKTANFSHEGVSIDARHAMISLFYQGNNKSVKTVIYEVNPVIFSGTHMAENVYTIFYPFLDNILFNDYIKENATIKEYYINKIIRTKRIESRLMRYVVFGYLGKYEKIKTAELDTTNLQPLIDQKGKVEVKMEKSKIEIFENTMNLIESNDANVIIVMMPMYRAKLQTLDNEGLSFIRNYFETLSSKSDNIDFIDFNNDSITSNTHYFSDPLHCNLYGQRVVTDIISSYLTGTKDR